MRIRSITAPNPGAFTLDGTRSWLLGETAVVDPGPLIDSHVAALLATLPHLTTILVTHRHADHAPAALPLREATGARILAPRGVLPDDAVALRLEGGETFDIEGTSLEVIATPGHTGEHVCFLTSSGDLFSGDTILGSGTTAIFPPDGHMGDYLRSLELLRSKHPKRLYPAHGPVRDDAVALIGEYLAHRRGRERQVLEALASGASTLTSLRETIYPGLEVGLHRAAEAQLTAHVIKLMEEGKTAQGILF